MPTALDCGQPFRPPDGGGLTLTGVFPAIAPAGELAVAGTVEATGRRAVSCVVAPRADVFLVRDGRVVTVPMPQDAVGVRRDFAPGMPALLAAEGTLVSCAPGGGRVPPGTYQLYVRVVLVPDDGAAEESFGGPWPLQVR